MTTETLRNIPTAIAERMRERLARLYGSQFDGDGLVKRLDRLASDYAADGYRLPRDASDGPTWTERDCVLITYGDQFAEAGTPPLQTLRTFLDRHALPFSDVHLLPCFPYTSDDGFSVSDYRTIDPQLGDWDDVAALAGDRRIAFDLVLNHCSQSHDWFVRCLADESPFRDYFLSPPPDADVSGVTRPRSHPLLTPFETAGGERAFWTTFSADQLDLKFANPQVLEEMLGVLAWYLANGGRIIRLDAIAYLWKELGTACIHLPQTHEVVKLMRDFVDAVAPDAILLTETNVPHAENVSYFGDGDEAHMVYQFSLAPLTLDAFINVDATYLNRWLANLEQPPPGCTYFNFTASHDGVGVRPLEGLAPPERRDAIVARVRKNGGRVSMKRNADGSESPYELNATWYSALQVDDETLSIRRFLSSQLLQICLAGIPGIYAHSLFGTPNWTEGVTETGQARTVNRRKLPLATADSWATGPGPRGTIFRAMRAMLDERARQPALHPNATETVHAIDTERLVVVERGDAELFLAINTTGDTVAFELPFGPQSLPPFGGQVWRRAEDGYETLPTLSTPSTLS